MNFILHLLLDAAVIFGLANLLPQVDVKSFGTAILIALLLGVFNFFIGWVISFPLNLVTLYLLTGLVRLFVTAVMLKLVDKLLDNFTIVGFWPALLIALAVSVAGSLIDRQAPTQRMIDSGNVAAHVRPAPSV